MIVQAAPLEHFGWLVNRTSAALTRGAKAIEAITSEGRIAGMVAFDMWTPHSVSMHIALDYPAALRALLRPSFEYAFIQAGRGLALATVIESNTRSRRLVEHVGFREVHRIADGWKPGEALILYQMTDAECRWISKAARKAA